MVLAEEGVGDAFGANGGDRAVAGDDGCGIGERQKAVANAGEEAAVVATGEVGASDRASEEGVAGEQKGVLREVDTEAAFGVAGGVEELGVESAGGEALAVSGGVVGRLDGGGGNAEPGGLEGHHGDEREVGAVVEDGGAGGFFEGERAGDVVDVRVGNDDALDGELVPGEHGEDAGDFCAGIDYEG